MNSIDDALENHIEKCECGQSEINDYGYCYDCWEELRDYQYLMFGRTLIFWSNKYREENNE